MSSSALLVLADGTKFSGEMFGHKTPKSGEVVFTTGMVGYPQALTDPSYAGQIMICTYPILGNYGINRDKASWESDRIWAAGLVVCNYIDTPSHYSSNLTLGQWLEEQEVPGLIVKDTRALAQKLREEGSMLGKIVTVGQDIPFYDPNSVNITSVVSTKEIEMYGSGTKTIVLLDCGIKRNSIRAFVERGMRVVRVPWDHNIFANVENVITHHDMKIPFDAIFISNGPGDPKQAINTIETIREALKREVPIFGICLGNQILSLAAGGDTSKMKFGHRSQNQPAQLVGTKKCFLTTQNHGFQVSKIPPEFEPWFMNANDGSNEGVKHKTKPFMSIQFHPESTPGPEDTMWIFDHFLTVANLK